ncbi:glutaredoxin domain-containing cysteine-rich protein CG12206-like [Melanaphis sacchari]|uniref:Glutaredoxin domain-containing cysteine-rich protein CG31559 n=1 Tax=Melanaphis sacchari TaxID=742174 RepID=A0A2H8TYQ9_9HEMI|nr:glutaredoxin domain-containing cysteine-rich protein CG12206-like [Melanaphis sacchari]
MLETVAEKKIPPPLPPKTRRGCLKTGVDSGCGGGATILQSNGHVVKIRIDPMMVDGVGSGGGCSDRVERDDGPRREHAAGRRSSTVKINITCVDPFVFRRHYADVVDDDEDDEDDDRRSSSGHRSPLDSGTGSDLDTGSRRDESDDGTCSCDSLTSSTADPETAVMTVDPAPPGRQIVAVGGGSGGGAIMRVTANELPATQTCTTAGVVATAAVATVVEELPKRSTPPPPPVVHVQQQCYNDAYAVAAAADRIIDMDNTDQYYSFHMNENVFDEVDATAVATVATPSDDTFAGCKTAVVASDTIRSAKGTIRGVKNRVRAGIATFLQPKTNKTWQEKEAGKVVLYTTTMGIVRETYQRCLQVRQILRTHLVKYVERDVFMSREVQKEIRERLGGDTISVPQLFVEGNLIGDAAAVDRLNESGELRSILKPFKSPDACTTCQVCGGYRLLPCPMCNGSKKSVHRNHFTTEMIALKCMNCDEVGLVQCYAC